MYSNNILNFQDSTTILNAHTKKAGNVSYAPRISIYIYIYIYIHTYIGVCVYTKFYFINKMYFIEVFGNRKSVYSRTLSKKISWDGSFHETVSMTFFIEPCSWNSLFNPCLTGLKSMSLRTHHTFFCKFHMVCTSHSPNIWWQTSVQAGITLFEFAPLWIVSKQIVFQN